MNILRKTQAPDANVKAVEIRNSFVEMEFKLKKALIRLEKEECLRQEEMFLIKENIQEIRELLTRDNI